MNEKDYKTIAKILGMNTGSMEAKSAFKYKVERLADYFEEMIQEKLDYAKQADPRKKVFSDEEREIWRNSFNKEQFLKDCGVK